MTKGSRYATFDAGSSGVRTYLDVCVWPTKPADTNCGQNSNNDDNQNESDNQGNQNDQNDQTPDQDDQSNQN